MSRPDDVRSYVLAAALVIVFVAVAVALTRGGQAPAPAPAPGSTPSVRPVVRSASPKRVRAADRPRPAAAKLGVADLHAIRIKARRRYAAQLDQRFRRGNFAAGVACSGPRATTLEFRWSEKALDNLHMERLKKTVPLRKEIHKLGFERLVMRVDKRIVWKAPLEAPR